MTELVTYPTDATPATESLVGKLFGKFLRSGVHKNVSGTNDFAPYANSTGMHLFVGTGSVVIEGFQADSDAEEEVTITEADSSLNRIDRVVLRLDLTGPSALVSLTVIEGTPASGTPTAPALSDTATVKDVPVAQVYVAAATGTISNSNVTDERTFSAPRNIGTVAPRGLAATAVNGASGVVTDAHHQHPFDATAARLSAPVGWGELWFGGSDPAGVFSGIYMICDGRALNRSTYNNLFALIGTSWGAGNNIDTFNIPDMRNRFPSGAGSVRGSLGTYSGDDLGVARHSHHPVEADDAYDMVIASATGESNQIATSVAPGNVNVTFSPLGDTGDTINGALTSDPKLAIPAYAAVNYIIKVL